MIVWVFLAVLVVVFVAMLVMTTIVTRRRAAADIAQLRGEQRERLLELSSEADARVERLSREASGARDERRDALARDLLGVVDSLYTARDSAVDPDTQRGIELVIEEVHRAFARNDIVPIEPAPGDRFVPEEQQSVDVVETSEVPDGTVARCMRAGFRSPDRVLRPAMVSVARAEADVTDQPAEAVAPAGHSAGGSAASNPTPD